MGMNLEKTIEIISQWIEKEINSNHPSNLTPEMINALANLVSARATLISLGL